MKLCFTLCFSFLQQEFCNTLDSSPPTSPGLDKPEVEQEVKPEVPKDKSSTVPTPVAVNDMSAIQDILQLLKVLYSVSTSSAYDFGDGKFLNQGGRNNRLDDKGLSSNTRRHGNPSSPPSLSLPSADFLSSILLAFGFFAPLHLLGLYTNCWVFHLFSNFGEKLVINLKNSILCFRLQSFFETDVGFERCFTRFIWILSGAIFPFKVGMLENGWSFSKVFLCVPLLTLE